MGHIKDKIKEAKDNNIQVHTAKFGYFNEYQGKLEIIKKDDAVHQGLKDITYTIIDGILYITGTHTWSTELSYGNKLGEFGKWYYLYDIKKWEIKDYNLPEHTILKDVWHFSWFAFWRLWIPRKYKLVYDSRITGQTIFQRKETAPLEFAVHPFKLEESDI